ncbi:NRDE family protein [Halomonas shantousis]
MCLIVFDWRPGSAVPLRLAANRDEVHARPSQALNTWQDAPHILGGRDLRAGGTWLAASRQKRLVAVTNVRAPQHPAPEAGPSRGALVHEALECASLEGWLHDLQREDAHAYAGFNLLACDGMRMWHLHHGPTATTLTEIPAGVHGLSNATLDTPWPKLTRACREFHQALAAPDWTRRSWELMHDTWCPADEQLPETGVSRDMERFLSPIFIVGETYGTRATTLVEWQADGTLTLQERRFGPHGQPLGHEVIAQA